MPWRVHFYVGPDGSRPVEEFLLGLSVAARAKAVAVVRLLQEAGPALPFPYSSQVRGRLRELRTRAGRERIRLLYFADARRDFILLHGLVKRSAALPEADIRLAEQRMAMHSRRLEER